MGVVEGERGGGLSERFSPLFATSAWHRSAARSSLEFRDRNWNLSLLPPPSRRPNLFPSLRRGQSSLDADKGGAEQIGSAPARRVSCGIQCPPAPARKQHASTAWAKRARRKERRSEELKQLSRTPTHPQDRAGPLVDHLLVLLGRGRKAVLERRVLAEDDLLWVVVSRWEIADSKKG